jgi:hypothetical protein
MTAKTTPPAPVSNKTAREAPAPAPAVGIDSLTANSINTLHLLLASVDPVTAVGPTAPPYRRPTLDGFVQRNLAVAVDKDHYQLSEQGWQLVALLWPAAKPAPAKRTRKPAADKAEPTT